MANSHPGSYSGKDAYSDMLVTLKVRNDNGDAKKTRCREILLGLWEAYVEKTLQGSVGEQQGIQQTEILRPEVHGRALDKPTENRDKLLSESCDYGERVMDAGSCEICGKPKATDVHHKDGNYQNNPAGQFDADLQDLPQQATQGGGEVQDLRKKVKGLGFCEKHYQKVQEIWKRMR